MDAPAHKRDFYAGIATEQSGLGSLMEPAEAERYRNYWRDLQIVQLLRAGGYAREEGTRLLLDTYGDRLNRIIRRILQNGKGGVEVEEVLYECASRAVLGIGSLRPWHSFRHWLFKIARNEAINECRRQTKVGKIKLVGDWFENIKSRYGNSQTILGPQEQVSLDEEIDGIKKVILALPKKDRILVDLRNKSELSWKMIAHEIDKKPTDVKTAYHRRTIPRLRKAMKNLGFEK